MAYECRQCYQTNDQAGTCPVCGIPMDIRMQNDQPVTGAPVDTPPVAPATQPMPSAPGEAPVAPEAPAAAPVEGAPAGGGEAPPVA